MLNFSEIYYYVNRLRSDIPYHILKGYAFPPVLTLVEITYACNVRCEFCQFYQFESGDKPKQLPALELEDIKRLVTEAPGEIMTFTGGEPFFRKDITEILDYTAKRRRFHMITNGTFLKPDIVDKVVETGCHWMMGKGFFNLCCSLQAQGKLHDEIVQKKGAYDIAVNGLNLLQEKKKSVGKKFPLLNLKMVVVNKNYQHILDNYDFAAACGADFFNVMAYQKMEAHYQRFDAEHSNDTKSPQQDPASDVESAVIKEQLVEIEKRSRRKKGPLLRFTPNRITVEEFVRYYDGTIDLRDYVCYSPWSKVFISAFGEIYICPFQSVGNIKETTIRETWNCDAARDFRMKLKDAEIFKGCMGCCSMELKGRRYANKKEIK